MGHLAWSPATLFRFAAAAVRGHIAAPLMSMMATNLTDDAARAAALTGSRAGQSSSSIVKELVGSLKPSAIRADISKGLRGGVDFKNLAPAGMRGLGNLDDVTIPTTISNLGAWSRFADITTWHVVVGVGIKDGVTLTNEIIDYFNPEGND